ncbi:MAG: hypothetical protein FWC71_08710 [Defluviitaleaceae bacterium]|nr:hypothetical protein [Defluviitaleaceae bacterium]
MKSVFGLTENLAAALSYLVLAFSGVVVLILERENKFVRFHALQSVLWFLPLMILAAILNFFSNIFIIRLLATPLWWLTWVVIILSGLFMMLKAYSGTTFKLPIVGNVAWSQIFK